MHRADREAGKRVRHDAAIGALGKAPDAEIELDVGPVEPRVAAAKPPAQMPLLVSGPCFRNTYCMPATQLLHRAVGDVVEGDRLGAAERQADIEMVLQLGADRRACRAPPGCRIAAACSPGPSPDSCNSCGEP